MLQQDNLSRGAHAIHVKRRRKLGKHLTIIKTAVPFINAILERPELKEIHFGRVIAASADGKPGFWIIDLTKHWQITIADSNCLQLFQLYVKSEEPVWPLVEVLQATARTHNIPIY